jgi:CheY-like chemotaxis protein
MEQIGTNEKIIDLVALDIEMQELATKEMIRRLKQETDKVNNQDIVRFNETSLKRSQLL